MLPATCQALFLSVSVAKPKISSIFSDILDKRADIVNRVKDLTISPSYLAIGLLGAYRVILKYFEV